MADATPIYAIPEPVLTDPLTDLLSVAAVSARVEAVLAADSRPNGDSSHSLVLTGSDIGFTATQNKTILSASVTLTRDQWVIISGRANLVNVGGNTALMGIYIDVDSTVIDALTSGNSELGTASPNDRLQLSIPAFSVFLTAGAHTIRLRGDRANNEATTINARAVDTGNITSHPCALNIIV